MTFPAGFRFCVWCGFLQQLIKVALRGCCCCKYIQNASIRPLLAPRGQCTAFSSRADHGSHQQHSLPAAHRFKRRPADAQFRLRSVAGAARPMQGSSAARAALRLPAHRYRGGIRERAGRGRCASDFSQGATRRAARGYLDHDEVLPAPWPWPCCGHSGLSRLAAQAAAAVC